MIRAAQPSDLTVMCELLAAANLPTSGVAKHLQTFLVVERAGEIVGVVGLEVYGSVGLLRSLVVEPASQNRGLAGRVCDQLEQIAPTYGVECLYLLTETAAPFFANRGYAIISRDSAPPEIVASKEFSEICPESAELMRRAV